MFVFSIFLFSVHLFLSLYMLGVIWFVQMIHYPMFLHFSCNESVNPFAHHQSKATSLALPMILELVSIALLAFMPYPNFMSVLILLVLTLLIWLSTFTLQVPAHKALKNEKSEQVIHRLIWTNWFRTGLWSLKAIYLFFLVWNLLRFTLISIS